jgi:hypothetical protein
MTIKVIEQQQEDGSTKFFVYHTHIVYHGDQDSDDFDPGDNHVVEVMAELPNPVALATWRDPLPMELAVARAAGAPRPSRVIDVICPDPMCGSVTTYPSNGDPEARQLHSHYAMHVGTGKPQVPMPEADVAVAQKLAQGQSLGEGEVLPVSAAQRLHIAVHGTETDGTKVDEGAVQHFRTTKTIQHQPIRPFVANDWALKAAELPVPTLAV